MILRHQAGDWGDALCAEDAARNDEALRSATTTCARTTTDRRAIAPVSPSRN
ncbi:hypothetical protein IEG05_00355 [Pseudomonas kunmingensis]|uniref:hypothetical protein n=1 Tax=Stutzerimonas kunmingensis TaxID=1211807 RepID=UPI0017460E2D|nr:hypothetical protein [Stutzerimonas kunmingensis]MBD3873688.1 hypothetical protein [Stutzerimonas kunmingensis]